MDFRSAVIYNIVCKLLAFIVFLDPQIRELGTNVEENKNLGHTTDFMIVHPSALSGDEKQL